MSFEKYVVDWFHEFVKDHEDDREWCVILFGVIYPDEKPSFWSLDQLDGKECFERLMSLNDAKIIYETLFGDSGKPFMLDDLPDTYQFFEDMLMEVGKELNKKYDFVKDFLEDMAYNANGYNNPLDFFKDLRHGGCMSGMIGMLIYNDDCKKFYIEHIDSLEFFFDDLEEELGEPIQKKDCYPYRYVFICHLCYEELAFKIAKELWEDEF